MLLNLCMVTQSCSTSTGKGELTQQLRQELFMCGLQHMCRHLLMRLCGFILCLGGCNKLHACPALWTQTVPDLL